MRTALTAGLCAAALLCAGSSLAQDQATPQSPNCPPLKQLAALKLTRDKDGLVMAPVGINGVPKFLWLETEPGRTIIKREVVDELNLPNRLNSVTVKALAIGNAGQFSNKTFEIYAHIPGSPALKPDDSSGTLGLDLLALFDIDFDLANDALNLFAVNHCDGQVVYWKTAAAVAIPFDWDKEGAIRFQINMDGRDLAAVLDTKAIETYVDLTRYRSKATFDPRAPSVVPADMSNRDYKYPYPAAKRYSMPVKQLDLGGIVLHDTTVIMVDSATMPGGVPVRLTDTNFRGSGSSFTYADVGIGLDIMAKLHIYVATKEKKLYVSPASTPVQ